MSRKRKPKPHSPSTLDKFKLFFEELPSDKKIKKLANIYKRKKKSP